MSATSISVTVCEGRRVLDKKQRPVRELPDGRYGVVFRGRVYPLIAGKRINTDDTSFDPERCAVLRLVPADLYRKRAGRRSKPKTPPTSPRRAITRSKPSQKKARRILPSDRIRELQSQLAQAEANLQSSRQELNTATATMTNLRRKADESELELTATRKERDGYFNELNQATAPGTDNTAAKAIELAAEKDRLDQRLRSREANLQAALEERDYYRSEAISAGQQVGALKERIEDLQTELADKEESVTITTPLSPNKKLHKTLREILTSSFRNIQFCHDSLDPLGSYVLNFADLCRELCMLDDLASPMRSERVKGTRTWFERHFNTGNGANGRIYHRYNENKREVFVSYKGSQRKDVQWLKAND